MTPAEIIARAASTLAPSPTALDAAAILVPAAREALRSGAAGAALADIAGDPAPDVLADVRGALVQFCALPEMVARAIVRTALRSMKGNP